MMRQLSRAAVFGAIGSVKRATASIELRNRSNGRPLRIMLGAGPHHREGWISTDIAIRHPSTVYLNITRRFPLADVSVDAYFLEHVIEHIPYDVGARMLAEIRRTLVPGGVVRIATPDLRQVARALDSRDDEAALYTTKGNERWNTRTNVAPIVPAGQIDNPCFTVNRMFYHWGHRFIYDESTLTVSMLAAGLERIKRCEIGESVHPHMRDLERHGTAIDPAINAFETMVLEATKVR
jgi:SAM-dependent methyltransferase